MPKPIVLFSPDGDVVLSGESILDAPPPSSSERPTLPVPPSPDHEEIAPATLRSPELSGVFERTRRHRSIEVEVVA